MSSQTEFKIFLNNKTKPRQSIRNVLKNRSMIEALKEFDDRLGNIESILKLHGLELPKQRGLKVV